ncbi:transposase [Aquimarina sp. ERC-38]|uniref:transposase n=1 Tax=Aquimarina sp. ERC-38 TaxID=2949996 RepID=UPI0022463F93|nr:transposase [Aquimarina sp. ERC-38]UZO79916.1 transposase [Aquimarina sp. ERC-38]UZO80060.1 transposase [Aquimarina sp. ERC-38]UZO81029.1 transposase [Aquimarina sp. ERC-38]UZO81879.1 transposase [Aquimarina sp. ERC-38]UZO82265.1 transposase [Aquimarina sp. ERC-38]
MRANLKSIQKRRKYSEDFKKQLVSDFESGKFSVPQLERIHKISRSNIYKWIYKYSTFNEHGSRVVEMKHSSSEKLKELEKKVKELEAALGRKQIKIDYLEKVVEIAKDELNIDIKKNFNTPQLGGSKSISK